MPSKQTKRQAQSKTKGRSKSVKLTDLKASKGGAVKGGVSLNYSQIKYEYK